MSTLRGRRPVVVEISDRHEVPTRRVVVEWSIGALASIRAGFVTTNGESAVVEVVFERDGAGRWCAELRLPGTPARMVDAHVGTDASEEFLELAADFGTVGRVLTVVHGRDVMYVRTNILRAIGIPGGRYDVRGKEEPSHAKTQRRGEGME